MKLLYIFLTTVLVLFGGKCVYASNDLGSELTMNQLRSALWHNGVSVVPQVSVNKSVSIDLKKKKIPEELSKAIDLELKKLYNIK